MQIVQLQRLVTSCVDVCHLEWGQGTAGGQWGSCTLEWPKCQAGDALLHHMLSNEVMRCDALVSALVATGVVVFMCVLCVRVVT